MSIIDNTVSTSTPTIGATIRYSGRELVVVGRHESQCLALDHEDHSITAIDPQNASWASTTAELDEVLPALATAAFEAQNRLQGVEGALASQQQLVQEIREYAIARHLDGDFCREGLDQALDHFGLDRYQPRHVVAVTINATVTVDADTEVSATERVQYLIDGVAYSGQTDHDHLDVALDAIDVEARY